MEKTTIIGIIDDDNDKLRIIEDELIKSTDFQAFVTSSPKEVENWVSEKEISLLAVDYNLGEGVNGIDIISKLRDENKDLPIVLFTNGVLSEEVMSKAEDLGINFFSKGSDIEHLIESIKSISKEALVDKDNQLNLYKKLMKKNEIRVFISCPGDVFNDLEHSISILERKFRKEYEKLSNKRILFESWIDLPSLIGYPQDKINEYIEKNIDVIITIFKHKLGTPTKNRTNRDASKSGSVEEIKIALENNEKGKLPIGMLYFHSEAPSINLSDSHASQTLKNWEELNSFRKEIENIIMYKKYSNEYELTNLILKDINSILQFE